MTEEHKRPSAIDNALAEMAQIAFPDPAICTGWVLVSEWTGGGDKDYWTVVFADDQQPEWRQKGLLHHAIDTWGEEDLDYEDDDGAGTTESSEEVDD